MDVYQLFRTQQEAQYQATLCSEDSHRPATFIVPLYAEDGTSRPVWVECTLPATDAHVYRWQDVTIDAVYATLDGKLIADIVDKVDNEDWEALQMSIYEQLIKRLCH